MKLTGAGQDGVRWPAMLASRIRYLASAVAVADFPPTDQHRDVHELLEERLRQNQQELTRLLENDRPAFNRRPEENNLPRLVVGETE